jgi:hypothetical protein
MHLPIVLAELVVVFAALFLSAHDIWMIKGAPFNFCPLKPIALKLCFHKIINTG